MPGSTSVARDTSCNRSTGSICRSRRSPKTTGNTSADCSRKCSSVGPSGSYSRPRFGTILRSSLPRRPLTRSPMNNSGPEDSGATWIILSSDVASVYLARSRRETVRFHPRRVLRLRLDNTTTRCLPSFAAFRRRRMRPRMGPMASRRTQVRCLGRWLASRLPTSAGSWSDRRRSRHSPTSAPMSCTSRARPASMRCASLDHSRTTSPIRSAAANTRRCAPAAGRSTSTSRPRREWRSRGDLSNGLTSSSTTSQPARWIGWAWVIRRCGRSTQA